ncbi:MAG TPA: LuxR C-terminal-related transcriptional regulator [Duganella sp.]
MLAAPDWEQLNAQVLALLAGTGISDFFIRIEVDVGDGSTCSHCFGSLPGALLQSFNANLKGQDDLVNRHIARSGLPLVWNTERLCGAAAGQPYALLRARGICEGISVTARDALAVSRVDFYRQAASGHGLPTSLTADLMLLGSYLHEAVRDLWNQQNSQQAPSLTEREQACLYWSAVGKTGKETAMILSISHHTVYFHLKNAARKFNVYSTRHAINRATRLGMIKPLSSAHG